ATRVPAIGAVPLRATALRAKAKEKRYGNGGVGCLLFGNYKKLDGNSTLFEDSSCPRPAPLQHRYSPARQRVGGSSCPGQATWPVLVWRALGQSNNYRQPPRINSIETALIVRRE